MENTTTALLSGIDTVIVRVSNIETSREWYTNRLGLSAVWEDAEMKLVVLDTKGPTSLTLWQTEKNLSPDHHTAAYPIFGTPDAAALRELLISRGIHTGELLQDSHTVNFLFYDPDGNVLEACQVKAG